MPSNWEATSLGAVTAWLSGGTPKKDEPNYWGGDIPWISANSMYGTRFSESELRLTEAGLQSGSRLAPKGTVLLLVRGGALHKRIPVGIATRDVAFNQDVKALVAREDKIRPWYLLCWLLGMERHLLDSVVEYTGIGAGKLDTKRMQTLEILLPSLSEQDEIIATVKSLDDRIDLLRQTNTTLESIAQALFKSWFIDFDPVRAKAEGREPEGMDAATGALFPTEFEESELGRIPKGWRVGNLGDLAELNARSWTARRAPTEVAYIDLASVKSNVFNAPQRFAFADAPSRARRELRAGDTLVGTVRPGNRSFGFIAEAEAGLTGSTGFAVLSPRKPDATAFIYLCATRDENIERLASLADGGAYPAVRPELVASTACTLPENSVMTAFAAVVQPLLNAVAENARRAQTLADIRDALLPRLISGKLRLPEAQEQLEDALA